MINNRIVSLDILKIISIFFVILIHTHFLEATAGVSQSAILFQAAFFFDSFFRVGVSLFFVLSGYFFARSCQKRESLWKPYFRIVTRLFIAFLVWSLIYIFIDNSAFDLTTQLTVNVFFPVGFKMYLGRFMESPIIFLLGGTSAHLWFLPALILSLTLLTLFVGLKQKKWLIATVIILHVFGILACSYLKNSFGTLIPFSTRNGPFYGCLYVTLGWLIYHIDTDWKKWSKKAILLIVVGILGMIWETFFIRRLDVVQSIEYCFFQIPLTLGFFIFALSKEIRNHTVSFFSKISIYSLGIYCIHYGLIKLVNYHLPDIHFWFYDFIFPFFVYVGSLLLAILISRISKLVL